MTGRTALVFEERRYSLPLLDALADGLATTLAKRGVTAGDRVALMAANRPEFVVAVRAVWRLGAAVVLISPAWKRDEVDHALALTSRDRIQVAPAEIEAVLHGHPAVKDCAVFGVPDAVDGEAVVAAVAVHAPMNAALAAELTERVAQRLASYKHLSRVVFVADIPRLPSGKVLRRVLKERDGCTSDI